MTRYTGEFRNGSRNGFGFWISNYLDTASDSYEGQYLTDKKNGYGIYKWRDGTMYEGEFLNDLKHGEGFITYGDGRKAELEWFEGSVAKKDARRARRGSNHSNMSRNNGKQEAGNVVVTPETGKGRPTRRPIKNVRI